MYSEQFIMKTVSGNQLFNTKMVEKPKNIPIIVIDSPKTPENIGAIIRIAGNLGISEIYLIAKESDFRMSKITKSSSNAHQYVNLNFVDYNFLKTVKEKDYQIIAIETCDNSSNLFEYTFTEKLVFVFGNESHGVSNEGLKYCDKALFIPLPGEVKSMNVSHAVSVTLFEYYRQGMDDNG